MTFGSSLLCVLLLVGLCVGSSQGLKQSQTTAARALKEKLQLAHAIGLKYSGASSGPANPVLLIPGIGGTQLEQKFVNTTPPHSFCSSTAPWSRVWLKLSNLVPELWDCFASRISRVFDGSQWHDKTGVYSRPGEGLPAIDYLDPANAIVRHESMYFAATTEALLAAGWTNETLGGMPYDWRKHPEEQPELFQAFQQKVEDLSAAMDGKPVVLVSHSMGGPFTHYFLNKVVSQSWKDKFVARWVAVCSPFGGAAVAVRALLSGYNFGIPVLTNSEGLAIGPNLGSTFYLLPRNDSNWPHLVDTLNGETYGPSEMSKVLDLSGMNYSSAKISTAATAWTTEDPGVRVDLVAGSVLQTEVGYEYDTTAFTNGPVQTHYDSGDATVPLKSALLPATEYGWSNIATTQIFPKVDHVGMLADSGFISWLVQELSE